MIYCDTLSTTIYWGFFFLKNVINLHISVYQYFDHCGGFFQSMEVSHNAISFCLLFGFSALRGINSGPPGFTWIIWRTPVTQAVPGTDHHSCSWGEAHWILLDEKFCVLVVIFHKKKKKILLLSLTLTHTITHKHIQMQKAKYYYYWSSQGTKLTTNLNEWRTLLYFLSSSADGLLHYHESLTVYMSRFKLFLHLFNGSSAA